MEHFLPHKLEEIIWHHCFLGTSNVLKISLDLNPVSINSLSWFNPNWQLISTQPPWWHCPVRMKSSWGCAWVQQREKEQQRLTRSQNHSKPIFISDTMAVYERRAIHQKQELIASAYWGFDSDHPENFPTAYWAPSRLCFVGRSKAVLACFKIQQHPSGAAVIHIAPEPN